MYLRDQLLNFVAPEKEKGVILDIFRVWGRATSLHACGDQGFKLKLNKSRFELDIRRKFFTTKVVRHWNRTLISCGF